MSWPILSVTTFLPLVGALFIMMMRGDGEAEKRNARWVALWTTLITFAISLIMLYRFDPSSAEFQFVEKQPWLGGAITYHMGVDGISLPFVILTTGADAGLHHRELAADPDARQGIHGGVPGARDADGRHLRGPRPGGVLPVLRGRAHSRCS